MYLGNDDVSYVSIFLRCEGVGVRMVVFLGDANAVARVVAMRVVVSMVRRVCMHPHNVHSPALLFPEHLPGRPLHDPFFRRPDPCLLIGGTVQPLLPLVVLSPNKVKEEREERRHHGEEPRERKLRPRELRQAGAVERFRSVGEHVDETGCENHPRRECLRGHEEVPVGAEEPAVFSNEGNSDSGHARQEDGCDCHELEDERGRVVSAQL